MLLNIFSRLAYFQKCTFNVFIPALPTLRAFTSLLVLAFKFLAFQSEFSNFFLEIIYFTGRYPYFKGNSNVLADDSKRMSQRMGQFGENGGEGSQVGIKGRWGYFSELGKRD